MALNYTNKTKPSSVTEQVHTASKAKTKPKAKLVPVLTETQTLVNELVDLDVKLKALEVTPITKRIAELKSRLQSIANEHYSADEEVTLQGTEGKVIFSPARSETNIVDREKMIKVLTPKVFIEIAKVNLGDLKKYLSEGEIQTFTETSNESGARTLKSVVPELA